jgi:hypothetical protein
MFLEWFNESTFIPAGSVDIVTKISARIREVVADCW